MACHGSDGGGVTQNTLRSSTNPRTRRPLSSRRPGARMARRRVRAVLKYYTCGAFCSPVPSRTYFESDLSPYSSLRTFALLSSDDRIQDTGPTNPAHLRGSFAALGLMSQPASDFLYLCTPGWKALATAS